MPEQLKRASDRPALWHVLVGLVVVVGLSALVGCIGTDEGFSWELASIFGTAAGTTLLAAATYWLGYSTRSEVRATQDLAELTRREQDTRERPVVLQEDVQFEVRDTGGGFLHVTLVNVGLGPALRVRVSAEHDQFGATWKPRITQEVIPSIAPGEVRSVGLGVTFPSAAPAEFQPGLFRVQGSYLDRGRRPENEASIITSWDESDEGPIQPLRAPQSRSRRF